MSPHPDGLADAPAGELLALGFGPFFERQLHPEDADSLIPARVAAEHRGQYEVWSARGAGRARVAGRLRRESEHPSLPGAGDWVLLRDEPGPDRTDDRGLGWFVGGRQVDAGQRAARRGADAHGRGPHQ